MEYELAVLDRVVLIRVLQEAPMLGSRLYYREYDKVARAISIPQAEQDAINWEQDPETGRITWDGTKAKVITLDIPECILSIIVAQLKQLDQQEQLRPEHIAVYDKFVPEEDDGNS